MKQDSAVDPSSPPPPGTGSTTEEEEELQLLQQLTFWGVVMFCWWIIDHAFIIGVLVPLLAMWLILWQHYVVLPVYWLNPNPTKPGYRSRKCALIIGLLLVSLNLLFCVYFAFINWIDNDVVNQREFVDGPLVTLYHIGTILAWFSFFYLNRMAYLMCKLYRIYHDRQQNLMQQAQDRGGSDQELLEGGEGTSCKTKLIVMDDSNLESTNVIRKDPDSTEDKDIEATA